MKRLNLSLVVIALLCIVGWAEHARGQRSNSAQQGWQYQVIDCDVQELNRLGAGGAGSWSEPLLTKVVVSG